MANKTSVANKRLAVAAVTTLVALATLTACSNSGSQANQTTPSTSASAEQAHNQTDVTFTQQMIQHHQQAIQMSDAVLAKQGIDARVADVARQVKAAQGPEIQQMRSWLSQWGTPTMPMMPGQSPMPGSSMTPTHGPMPSPSDAPHDTGTASQTPTPGGSMTPSAGMMPGMMSPSDMTALQNAQGADASKLFLQQMTQHHQGAITMAQNEINAGQFPPAIALARSIVTSQQQEITTMQNILSTL